MADSNLHLSNTARSVGCCGASCKEDCARPPCPCNLDAWTPEERRDIIAGQRKRGRAGETADPMAAGGWS